MENKNEIYNQLSTQQQQQQQQQEKQHKHNLEEEELVDNRVTKKYSDPTFSSNEVKFTSLKKLYSSQNNLQNKDKCAICKTLNTFNCEHKTPVRDQFRLMFAEDGKYYVSPRLMDNQQNNSINYNNNNNKRTNLSKSRSNSDSKLNLPPKPSKKPSSKVFPDERVTNAYKRKPFRIPSNDNKSPKSQKYNENFNELPTKNGIYKLKDEYDIDENDEPRSKHPQKPSKQDQQSQKPPQKKQSKSSWCSII